jgi:diguanylate cyclase (GGDEF)-like protein
MTHDPTLRGALGILQGAVRLYEQAARLAKLGAWECCLETEKLTWTDGVYDLFEMCPGSPIRRPAIVDLYVDESRQAMETMRAEALATGMSCTGDFEIRTVRGVSRWMRLSIDVAHEDGRPIRLFGAKQDITREHEAWLRLRQSAERDPLTGLANRAVFDQRYRAMVDDALNYSHVSALVLVDLDHFKRFNDGFGHLAGDECLRQVAARLQRVFADATLIARIGGDEFAVLLRAPLSPARVRHILHQASATLCKQIRWNGARLDVGASIGVTILGRPHIRKASELFAEADAALYDAKAAGRTAVRVFGDDPHRTAVPRAGIA